MGPQITRVSWCWHLFLLLFLDHDPWFLSGTNPWLTLPFSLVEFRWSFEDGSGSTMNTCTWLFSSIYSCCICFSFLCCGTLGCNEIPNCEQHNCCIELQNSNPQKLPVSNMRTIVLWCMLLPCIMSSPSTKLSHPHKHILVTGHWIGGSSLPPVDGHPRW